MRIEDVELLSVAPVPSVVFWVATLFSISWPIYKCQTSSSYDSRIYPWPTAEYLRCFRKLKGTHLTETELVSPKKDSHVLVRISAFATLPNYDIIGQLVHQKIDLSFQAFLGSNDVWSIVLNHVHLLVAPC